MTNTPQLPRRARRLPPRPAWLTPAEQSRLDRFRIRVREAFGRELLDLRLFGSRARGEGHPESDLDVLVVLQTRDGDRWDRVLDLENEIFVEDGYPLQGQISPRVLSRAQWKFLVDRERLLAREIQAQGIPL
ncbi:MAG: nucleotidyltransferase domain-containing protein [Deltaproteobacteria bacterium]|nr:nucleotidyltransferase domain-containing protein [Deltaproteobacteria bacterium]